MHELPSALHQAGVTCHHSRTVDVVHLRFLGHHAGVSPGVLEQIDDELLILQARSEDFIAELERRENIRNVL